MSTPPRIVLPTMKKIARLLLQIEEVQGVTQVVDEAEATSNEEFARFEEKLRERKGISAATA
ncbi:MAG: hypothetical protein Q9221_004101 [Calogaya cf. arnoldii]